MIKTINVNVALKQLLKGKIVKMIYSNWFLYYNEFDQIFYRMTYNRDTLSIDLIPIIKQSPFIDSYTVFLYEYKDCRFMICSFDDMMKNFSFKAKLHPNTPSNLTSAQPLRYCFEQMHDYTKCIQVLDSLYFYDLKSNKTFSIDKINKLSTDRSDAFTVNRLNGNYLMNKMFNETKITSFYEYFNSLKINLKPPFDKEDRDFFAELCNGALFDVDDSRYIHESFVNAIKFVLSGYVAVLQHNEVFLMLIYHEKDNKIYSITRYDKETDEYTIKILFDSEEIDRGNISDLLIRTSSIFDKRREIFTIYNI